MAASLRTIRSEEVRAAYPSSLMGSDYPANLLCLSTEKQGVKIGVVRVREAAMWRKTEETLNMKKPRCTEPFRFLSHCVFFYNTDCSLFLKERYIFSLLPVSWCAHFNPALRRAAKTRSNIAG